MLLRVWRPRVISTGLPNWLLLLPAEPTSPITIPRFFVLPGVSPAMDGLGLVIRPDSGSSAVVGGLEPGNYLASLVCPGSGDGTPTAGPSLAVGDLRSVITLAPVPPPAESDLGPTNCGSPVDSSPVGGVGAVTSPGLEPSANVKPETLLRGSCYVDCVAHWLRCSGCSQLNER